MPRACRVRADDGCARDRMCHGIRNAQHRCHHGKTVGQVILLWNVQRGVVVIPKSTHVERIRENIDIWDFELTADEMATISGHDMGYSGSRAKHFEPSFVRMCLGKE